MAKFKWVPPTQSELNKKIKETKERQSLYDSITLAKYKQFKPKAGENRIRLLPPTGDTGKYFSMPITVHFGCGPDNGTYLCEDRMFGEPCAVCDEQRALREAGDSKAANAIKPVGYNIAWVIDRDAKDEVGPQIFRFGYTMNLAIAAVSLDESDGGAICVFDPEEGYDLTFAKEEKGGDAKNVAYLGHRFARRPSPVHRDQKVQEEWLDFIYDNPLSSTLQRYEYDHVAKCFGGKRTVREDEPEEELPPRTSRSVRDDDEDEDDRTPPPRRREEPEEDDRRRVREPEPEEETRSARRREEEDDEDDTPPPRRVHRQGDEEPQRRATRSVGEQIGDAIPERAGGYHPGERTNGKSHDDPPFEGGERRRPRLQEEEEPHERAGRAVDRLRERARR